MRKKVKIKTTGLSKRSSMFRTQNQLPKVKGISQKLMIKINEALINYKNQIPRYLEVRNNPESLRVFCSMNRNPLHDITGVKYFSTGLKSRKASKCPSCETSKDHFIQRTKALQYIFRDLNNNPNMDVMTFISLLEKYCSTVILTKEEHRNVTTYGRRNPNITNVKIYKKLRIKINGLGAWCNKHYIVRVVEKSF